MTNEIVRLDLCTDKALNNVFRKHIKYNIGKLDEVRYFLDITGGLDGILPIYIFYTFEIT